MPSKEIERGSSVLVLKNGKWVRGLVQEAYRDRYGVIAVRVDGVRYEVARFKKR